MKTPFHPRGFWNGLLRQSAWHLREWMRNPEYRALHRFHRQLARTPRKVSAEVRFQGKPIRLCDGPSFLSAWDEIFVNRIYDIAVPPGRRPVLVDAGANIGLAALRWKCRYGDFEYLGFEPDPNIAECCRANLTAWSVGGRLIEAAVGESEGTAAFLPDGADAGRLVEDPKRSPAGARTVAIHRLAPLLPEQVDLLKIDVEGAEAAVLRDIQPCLGRIASVFVEWHGQAGQAGLGAAIAGFETAGFDCFVQSVHGPERPFLRLPQVGDFSQQLSLFAVRR